MLLNKSVKKLLISLLFLLLCFLFTSLVMENVKDFNGSFGFNKIIGITENIRPEQINHFRDNSSYLELLYTAEWTGLIESSYNQAKVNIIQTEKNYPVFIHTPVLKGSFLTGRSDEDYEIVLEEEVAYQLFKSTDVIGLTVNYLGQNFKIVGITENRPPFLNHLSHRENLGNVYIGTKEVQNGSRKKTESIQIAFKKENEELALEEFASMTPDQLGMQYMIKAYEIKKQIEIKNWIFLLLFSIMAFYYLALAIIKFVKKIMDRIKERYQEAYLGELIYKSYKEILLTFMALAVYLLAIFGLLKIFPYTYELLTTNVIKIWGQEFKEALFNVGAGSGVLSLFSISILILDIFYIFLFCLWFNAVKKFRD